MRGVEPIVKAPEQGGGGLEHLVVKDAGELLLQRVLGHAIVIVQAGLGPPADVQGGVNVGSGPGHDLTQLLPVVHGLEIQVFHRGAGDDQPVVIGVLDLIKGGIEGFQMAVIHVLGDVADGLQKFHLSLQGAVGKFAQQLGLRDDLGGHQVQNQQL